MHWDNDFYILPYNLEVVDCILDNFEVLQAVPLELELDSQKDLAVHINSKCNLVFEFAELMFSSMFHHMDLDFRYIALFEYIQAPIHKQFF